MTGRSSDLVLSSIDTALLICIGHRESLIFVTYNLTEEVYYNIEIACQDTK